MSRAATFSLFHPGICSGVLLEPSLVHTKRGTLIHVSACRHTHTNTHTQTYIHTNCVTQPHISLCPQQPPHLDSQQTQADTGTDGHVPSSSSAGRGRRLQVQHTHKLSKTVKILSHLFSIKLTCLNSDNTPFTHRTSRLV